MPSKKKKTVVVREHFRKVSKSVKNPTGKTIVDRHLRHIDGSLLDLELINETYKNYNKKNILWPNSSRLGIPDEDKYDEMIAVWVDYFSKALNTSLDPNMVKALIASESTFKPGAVNKQATGLTQITSDTLKILQDLDGEVKDFVFKDVRKSDLKDPNVSVALGVRWLAYKKKYAERVLNREATSDEVIQVYKGILNDSSLKAQEIMKRFRKDYGKLK